MNHNIMLCKSVSIHRMVPRLICFRTVIFGDKQLLGKCYIPKKGMVK